MDKLLICSSAVSFSRHPVTRILAEFRLIGSSQIVSVGRNKVTGHVVGRTLEVDQPVRFGRCKILLHQ